MEFDEDLDFGAQNVPAIYDHTDLRTDFRAIDFNKQVTGDSLFPQVDVTFGVINKVQWFDAPGGLLVVEENNTYEFQVAGLRSSLPVTRQKQFVWYNRDGTPNAATKTVRNVYDLDLGLEWQTKRRTRLIRRLETEIFGTLAVIFATDGVTPPEEVGFKTALQARSLRASLSEPVQEFIETGNTVPLATAFTNDTSHVWLGTPTVEFPSLRQQSIARLL